MNITIDAKMRKSWFWAMHHIITALTEITSFCESYNTTSDNS